MASRVIEIEHDLGDHVFLVTDEEQCLRIVTALKVTSAGVLYQLSFRAMDSTHYAMEITKEKSYKTH